MAAAVARGKVGFAGADTVESVSPDAPVPPTATVSLSLRSHPMGTTFGGPHGASSVTTDPSETARAFEPALAALTAEDVLTPVVEEAYSFMPGGLASLLAARGRERGTGKKAVPKVERLETVRLLSCNVIAGHVFLDADDDGLFDAGESPIPGSLIELRNGAGVVVGTATTDASGTYSFSTDGTIDTTPTTLSQSITIPATLTNFTTPFALAKFNPDLGELLDVEITVHGQLTSVIRAENTSTSSPETIEATVAGEIRLTGPGLDLMASVQSTGETFNAAVYDGTTDYAGPSGHDFGARTATIDQTYVLSKSNNDDLSAFIGSGDFLGIFDARARSRASGGGNLDYQTASSAQAIVTAVYRYRPNTCLAPGNYTLVQVNQPPNTLNGKRSSEGQVFLPPASGPDMIPVTLTDRDLLNNDFGEIVPARLSGFVYVDSDNDAVKDAAEAPIPGVTVTLTGTDDLGQPVNLSATTDANGAYAFVNLRPGTYRIVESQPSNFLDGKDAVGTQGGTLANDQIDAIVLGQGTNGTDNNFGELRPASLSGFVYFDRDDDGVKDVGETGIPGTTVTLTGTDDLGQSVNATATTDANGAYAFANLRPGTYRIVEAQPSGWLDGKDTIGSQGGIAGQDELSAIALGEGVDGTDNNFGELTTASLSGFVYHDANDDGVKDAGEDAISGVTVTLTGTDDLGQPVNLSTTTDANGAYAFVNLRPGTYRIVESQPSAYLDGKDAVGTQGGTLGDDQIDAIALLQGVNGTDNNFGEVLPGRLNGYVYFDLNRNGLRDPGEVGFANIPIQLTGSTSLGPITPRFVTTDANGFYSFEGLRPGVYTVTQTAQPTDFLDGQESRGNQTPLPNTRGTDFIAEIVVLAGGIAPDNNFGEEVEPDVACDVINQVEEVTRLGIHHQPTRILIRFSNDVDPASATNPANYRLVQIYRNGRLARREVPIRSATYDPATRTVTLALAHPINIHHPYQLTVDGVLDICGDPIDGDRDGLHGGAFVTTVTRANYPHSLSDAAIQAQKVEMWGGRFPRLAHQRRIAGPRTRRA
ncbi:MAG: SdrD B-like domain-containing protein [Isosphaeraceae bacterium]